ncbi:MAG: sugar-binding protein [Candidatus Latescibacteria bacterium]|nr:sugar-binding protein [Candidatus Latescibacterota bacterium]HJP29508.1 sugar-binding protein [Candidatus Latescibacterota bacterium]
MEKLFANIYRMGRSNPRGTSYTYFLKRPKGNLLVVHGTAPTDEDLVEIETLGGIDSQWVCHSHDAIKGTTHKQIHERFGAPLHVHRIDRGRVRSKARCEMDVFEGDGTTLGDDFEAFFLPTCSPGHSVYRWKSRGKYYLFTSHAMYYRDDAWDLQFNRHNDWHGHVGPLSKQHIDYVLPGYAPSEEKGFYSLDDEMRKGLAKALRAVRGKLLPKPPQLELAGLAKGLKLDGNLSAAWKRVLAVDLIGNQGNTPEHAASCRIAYDAQYLWFCFDNDEPQMDKLTAKATKRDSRKPAIWDDDNVEIFVCPDAKDRTTCYQFIVNANAAVLDQASIDSYTSMKWTSDTEANVSREKNKWIAQIRIPLADLGVEPSTGKKIGLNVYRNRVCGATDSTASGWSAVGLRSHLTPSRFGVVTLGT